MKTMTLEDVIKQIIKNLNEGKVDNRVTSFIDYKSKYAVLKPEVKVEISLTKGIVATIDVSDFFKEDVK